MAQSIKRWFLGSPKDPMEPETRKRIALVAFLAWVGLGADGLSSSCYGPEQAYRALGHYHHLALYLAFAISITVFIIALGYNQVIRVFPNGGGGYRASTELIGPIAGLISGVALIIDYMLTIVTSIAGAGDAIFSLLPYGYQAEKLPLEVILTLVLIWLNLRGTKESIKLLMPILVSFFVAHVIIIAVGIGMHGADLPSMVTATVAETHGAFHNLGFLVVIGLFMRAYSLGASTYTGIEAVSNNVNILAEPKVRTGKLTMLYMASSLSITAGGIILLYLLWQVKFIPGMTLNASVFTQILGTSAFGHLSLILLLALEAGVLFIAANTGFLGGPAVMANMSLEEWVPKRFRWLSSQLVKQKGILFFGVAALIILLISGGSVDLLTVLYSINVFITFSLTLFGMSRYFWRHRDKHSNWFGSWSLSVVAFIICVVILCMGIITKFDLGGWLTLLVTFVGILICWGIRYQYRQYKQQRDNYNKKHPPKDMPIGDKLKIDKKQMTAIFLVKDYASTLHSIKWVEKSFRNLFINYVFISHGMVDNDNISSDQKLLVLKRQTKDMLASLQNLAQSEKIPSETFSCFGADTTEDLVTLIEQVQAKYPNSVYFATRYIYPKTNPLERALRSNISTILQRKLQLLGLKVLTVPLLLK